MRAKAESEGESEGESERESEKKREIERERKRERRRQKEREKSKKDELGRTAESIGEIKKKDSGHITRQMMRRKEAKEYDREELKI